MAVSDRIAVMSQGRVVQEGTAQDLYHRPVNEFVATFVGRVNLIPGRIVDVAGGVAAVSALGTTMRVHSVPSGVGRGDARAAGRAARGDRARARRNAAPLAASVRLARLPGREDRVRRAMRGRDAACGSLQRRPGRGDRRRRERDAAVRRGRARAPAGERFMMRLRRLAILAFAAVANAAHAQTVVHGSADAYAAQGVAMAWGVARGASEASTSVVVRVVTDASAYPWLSVRGIDPFTKAEQPLERARVVSGHARRPDSAIAVRRHAADRMVVLPIGGRGPRGRRRRSSSTTWASPTRRPSSPTTRGSRPISRIASPVRARRQEASHDARRARPAARSLGAEARSDRGRRARGSGRGARVACRLLLRPAVPRGARRRRARRNARARRERDRVPARMRPCDGQGRRGGAGRGRRRRARSTW